ncbi:SEFIR domain-containing protein [Pseudomonas cichorii]|nr:SEFIR domain-containing protein [Pseudomonas cichorii]
MTEHQDQPKLFLSYSWSTPEHEAWVVELAEELAAAGIHVILDKWDLREGQEASAFMEQMLSDPSVTKIALLCDRVYAEKANGRVGGVGTEAQIISAGIYNNASNTKFVAVVRERDEHGHAYLPTYYTSRIYIDLSESARYASEFDRLIRWAHDQPLHVRPPTGKKPAYLERENRAITLVTSAELRRAIDAIKTDRSFAEPALNDYLTVLSEGIEQFRIKPQSDIPFDDQVASSIEDFLPYRNEAIELFSTVARYRDTAEARRHIHRFFEKLLPYQERPHHITQYQDTDFDNFRFIVHELFLYAVATLLKEEKFEFANELIGSPFYLPGRSEYGRDVTVTFGAFRTYAEMFERRNDRLKLGRSSLRAFLLEQRSHSSGYNMRELMQADFVLFLRDRVQRPSESFPWYPETLVYAGRHSGPFELFARSKSKRYFKHLKLVLGIDNKAALGELLSGMESGNASLPRWDYQALTPRTLSGFEHLDTTA